jgi:hypothetical protein
MKSCHAAGGRIWSGVGLAELEEDQQRDGDEEEDDRAQGEKAGVELMCFDGDGVRFCQDLHEVILLFKHAIEEDTTGGKKDEAEKGDGEEEEDQEHGRSGGHGMGLLFGGIGKETRGAGEVPKGWHGWIMEDMGGQGNCF